MKKILTLSCFLFLSTQVFTQNTKSNIYLLEYEMEDDEMFFESAYFLNSFNFDGYNGDVEFLGDDQILAVVNSNISTSKTAEIVLLDVDKRAYEVITSDNKRDSNPAKIVANSFSAIQTNSIGDNKLNIYKVGSEKVEQVFQHLDNIQNATWLDHNQVVLNLKSDLHYLAIGNKSDNTFKITEANVDKGVLTKDKSIIYYVHKLKEKVWYLKEYETKYKKKKTIIQMPLKSDNFAFLNDGTIVCSSGSELLRYDPSGKKEWVVLEDLWQFGIRKIIDLKVRNNKLLVVSAY